MLMLMEKENRESFSGPTGDSSAKDACVIEGLVPHLVEGGLTHLQHADDTIIFMTHNDKNILAVKFPLYCFVHNKYQP